MKALQAFAAVMLLFSSAIVLAEKPDPVDNPPLQVREANIDTNGYIAVHEQGTVDVEVTNAVDQDGVIPLVIDDQAGKQPVQWNCGNAVPSASVITGCLSGGSPWVVPEGKRLVIETISVQLQKDPNVFAYIDIRTLVDGERINYWIPLEFTGVMANTWAMYTALLDIKLYADPEPEGSAIATPIISVRKESQTDGAYVIGAISGYLIDN